jgi:hypothetical protein
MDDQKRKEARARLDAMFREQFLAMKSKGATAADLSEPAFQDLLRELVFERLVAMAAAPLRLMASVYAL